MVPLILDKMIIITVTFYQFFNNIPNFIEYKIQMQTSQQVDNAFRFNLILDQKEQLTHLPEPDDEYPENILHHQESLVCYSSRGSHKHNDDKFDYIVKDQFILAAVYDGHGGSSVSLYLKDNLLKNIGSHPQFQTEPMKSISQCIRNIQEQVTNRFQQTIGSTLLVVLWTKSQLLVANLGDGNCYGFQNNLENENKFKSEKEQLKNTENNNEYKKIQLNYVHNLENQTQRNRVRNKGGSIFRFRNSYRVAGELNISRSIGDKKYKKWISAQPSITSYPNNFDHVVLSTDGFSKIINACANAQQVMKIVQTEPYIKDNSTLILISRPANFL